MVGSKGELTIFSARRQGVQVAVLVPTNEQVAAAIERHAVATGLFATGYTAGLSTELQELGALFCSRPPIDGAGRHVEKQ